MIPEMNETLLILKNLATGIWEYFTLKFVSSIIIPFAAFLFGADSYQIMLALLVLCVIDFITGISSAKISGEPIKSRRAVRSAFKVAVYGLLVSAGHLTEGVIPGNFFIEEAVTTFLALTELISIVENIGKMGFAVPQKLLNQLQSWRDGNTPVEDLRVGPPTRRADEIVVHPEILSDVINPN